VGIESIPLSGARLPEFVARHLLARYAGLLPDLSGLIVLVPNHRAGQDFTRALAREAGLPALVPPRIMPLKAWAESQAEPGPEPASRRHARLYALLKAQTWLGNVDRWALAQELLQLADQLSAARPEGRIADALRAVQNAPNREIALVEAVWSALNNDGNDPHARYAAALERMASAAQAPLSLYSPGPLTATEIRFLENYSSSQPVTLFEPMAESSVAQCLHSAWLPSESSLKARAESLANAFAGSPLQDRIKLCPAPHLEAEARAAATWVGEQLQAGQRNIALIALDRLTARRVRALLERVEVLVEDETGWTLSTTASAAVIDRWLACLADDFPHVELLDLLKSPFLLGDPSARQDAVLRLELAMRRHGVAQSRADIWRLAQSDPGLAEAVPLLDSLFGAAQAFSMRRAPLAIWLTRLNESLQSLRALAPLAADAAGSQLLDRLDTLRRELAGESETHTFGEWRRWLDWVLESENFSDKSVSSPVVLTSLPNARGRSFEAVAVLGADAAHLPGAPSPGFFNQAVHAALGLPTAVQHLAQLRDDLLSLAIQGNTLFTWQAWVGDEPNPPSPFITLLQTLHKCAWGRELDVQSAAAAPAQPSTLPQTLHMPAPAITAAQLPRRYSPTSYQTLLDCPYRFFARNVLGLKELDEADEALDKSDYGNALHAILKRFHDSGPPQDHAAALALLDKISMEEFTRVPAYSAAAWRVKWKKNQSAYIDLWLAHTARGWRYQSGETELEARFDIPGLGDTVLHGRADRIDRNGDALRVIDYKTTAAARLKKKAEDPGENVQLPFYAGLAEAEAAFLPVDTDQPDLVVLDPEANIEAITLRLPQLLEAIANGAPLSAHGIDAVCQYCEARGLCRKGGWDAQ
jgi:ATP-dependent helicase/nuclease subunit B